jgi:S-formylglutathione hydrolase FrmB
LIVQFPAYAQRRAFTDSNMFGDLDAFEGSANDLFYLAQKLATSNEPQPRLFQCCGTEDFLYDQNQRFLALAQSLNLDLTYEEGPGEHEWGYWDRMISRVLAWIGLEKGVVGQLLTC